MRTKRIGVRCASGHRLSRTEEYGKAKEDPNHFARSGYNARASWKRHLNAHIRRARDPIRTSVPVISAGVHVLALLFVLLAQAHRQGSVHGSRDTKAEEERPAGKRSRNRVRACVRACVRQTGRTMYDAVLHAHIRIRDACGRTRPSGRGTCADPPLALRRRALGRAWNVCAVCGMTAFVTQAAGDSDRADAEAGARRRLGLTYVVLRSRLMDAMYGSVAIAHVLEPKFGSRNMLLACGGCAERRRRFLWRSREMYPTRARTNTHTRDCDRLFCPSKTLPNPP